MTDGQPDLVLHGARLWGRPDCDAVAVAGGAIVACGRFSELSASVGPRTYLIPLGGRLLAPGFIDSHLHFMEAAAAAAGVRLNSVRSLQELEQELRQAAARTAPGNWLRVFGCDESLLRERRGPRREELDRATPRHPLRLRHQTLHASWLNSRAIALLGLERSDFIPPPGARLSRDANGRVESLVVGMEDWLGARLPRVLAADLQSRARTFSRELAAAGVTAFTDAGACNDLAQLATLAELCAAGAITQRISVMLGEGQIAHFPSTKELSQGARVACTGIKFRAAPASPQRVESVRRALEMGASCAFHATEIEELEAALNAVEAAVAGLKRPPTAPCRIEHGGIITDEQATRIAALGAWVVTNPGFIYYRGAKYCDEPGLTPYLYRARSLLRTGIPLAAGTDAPVTPARPLVAIAAAIARTTLEGAQLGADEALPLPQAFDLFTRAGAELAGWPAGALQPGLAADMIVMAADPSQLTPAELAAVPIDLTIIGGRVVYERGRPETITGIPGF
ncbi:MAG TPA: amidohydrolase family protein [Candidatus Binataceae bacterium]|nr:amidohydrolase family protein [Candidatus Binataceae bacterium]